MFINVDESLRSGLDRTMVSIMHCGCIDPGSIPGLVTLFAFCFRVKIFLISIHQQHNPCHWNLRRLSFCLNCFILPL